jgi:UDP-hydrolysing UDP-N-acetyl-D-glucosamine 2-epimerase
MRTIAVITTGRADYGIYRSLLRRLTAGGDAALKLIAGGMHLRPEYGDTLKEIEDDGFTIDETVDLLGDGDSAHAVAQAMGRGVAGFAEALARLKPDMAVVLGDRFEMFAAAAAACPLGIPLAHIHGGELSHGSLDDAFRHAITKLSHLHFAACEQYARRIRQMGEEDWRVHVSGAPGLDNLDEISPLAGAELAALIGMELLPAPLLVTYHPATIGGGEGEGEIRALLGALDKSGRPIVITAPNADAGGRALAARLKDFAAGRDHISYVESLGTRGYLGMMAAAAAMLGNSSSGIIEAASLALPAVNVGSRQDGRLRPANVIDARAPKDIAPALGRALSGDFRDGLSGLENPFRASRPAADIIYQVLVSVPLDAKLTSKEFRDR